ncbi:hypothetical protein U1Q18_047183 [Sarracenia purpurea var. burkii]
MEVQSLGELVRKDSTIHQAKASNPACRTRSPGSDQGSAGSRRSTKKELDGYEADRKLAQMHVESAEIVVLGFQWDLNFHFTTGKQGVIGCKRRPHPNCLVMLAHRGRCDRVTERSKNTSSGIQGASLFLEIRGIDSEDPLLRKHALASYASFRHLFDDVRVMESRKTTLGARLEDYLSERGYPAEYDMEDLCEICAGLVGWP